jgi:preprotein translocase SecE subunit
MAKSKSARSSSASLEKSSTNQIVQQYQAVRSEIRKVTWPSRQEVRTLTTAVGIGMVIMAIFLYLVDAFFQIVIGGIIDVNIYWIIAGIIIGALLGFAFYSNSKDA